MCHIIMNWQKGGTRIGQPIEHSLPRVHTKAGKFLFVGAGPRLATFSLPEGPWPDRRNSSAGAGHTMHARAHHSWMVPKSRGLWRHHNIPSRRRRILRHGLQVAVVGIHMPPMCLMCWMPRGVCVDRSHTIPMRTMRARRRHTWRGVVGICHGHGGPLHWAPANIQGAILLHERMGDFRRRLEAFTVLVHDGCADAGLVDVIPGPVHLVVLPHASRLGTCWVRVGGAAIAGVISPLAVVLRPVPIREHAIAMHHPVKKFPFVSTPVCKR
mmetsp:Transcript_3716/g.7107  ORF Transcript_3716/g.7107 Transcript_3716/m.7107 type:complete len:269 (+) Transcript_3716:291-1097(+)